MEEQQSVVGINKKFDEHQPELTQVQQSTRAASIKHSGLVDVYTISQTCHERRKEPSTSRLHQLKYSLAIKIVSPTKPIN